MTSTPTAPAGGGRIPSLDGLRAVSVFIVMCSHAGFGDYVPGGLGVTIFFFLSGFLITGLLHDEQRRTGTIHLRHFYLRRFLRLSPPLYLTLLVAYTLTATGLLGGGISPTGVFAQSFYLTNYMAFLSDGPYDVPAGTVILWSLAVEEHYYLVFPPLLLWLLPRLTVRQTAAVLLAACAAALAWRLTLYGQSDAATHRIYYASDTRFDSILYGAVLALYLKASGTGEGSPSYRFWLRHSGLFAAGGLALIGWTLYFRNAEFRETWRYTLQGLALIPVFLHCTRKPASPTVRWLDWGWMQRIGVYSYVIYLTHFVIVNLVRQHAPADTSPWQVLLVALVGSVACAAFVDRVVEPPFRRLRRRFAD